MNTLDLKLEKETYNPGEKVKGTVELLVDSDVEIRSLKFLVSGIEKTWTTVSGYQSSQRYEQKNTLFSKDIYNYLKSATTKLQSKRGKYGFVRGTWVIPFEFVLPQNALESYEGKHVSIGYKIEALAAIAWKKDMAKQISFNVVVGDNNKNIDKSVVGERTKVPTSNEEEQETDLILELQGQNEFYRGEVIGGKIKIMKRSKRMLGGVEVKLSGIEYAVAEGQQETSVIEKYARTIELTNNYEDIHTVPFEIEIPLKAKRSYVGKYSQYYWQLDAKVDVPRGFDLKATAQIQVV